jgi:hypothetical protein
MWNGWQAQKSERDEGSRRNRLSKRGEEKTEARRHIVQLWTPAGISDRKAISLCRSRRRLGVFDEGPTRQTMRMGKIKAESCGEQSCTKPDLKPLSHCPIWKHRSIILQRIIFKEIHRVCYYHYYAGRLGELAVCRLDRSNVTISLRRLPHLQPNGFA